MNASWKAAVLALSLSAAAAAEKLTVLFTPKENFESARGTVIVLASPRTFSPAWAGLMTAYGGRMLAKREVNLRAGQLLEFDLDDLPPQLKHVGVVLDTNHNFMWRGMPDAGEYSSARAVDRSGPLPALG